jgi:hypothetical protein
VDILHEPSHAEDRTVLAAISSLSAQAQCLGVPQFHKERHLDCWVRSSGRDKRIIFFSFLFLGNKIQLAT